MYDQARLLADLRAAPESFNMLPIIRLRDEVKMWGDREWSKDLHDAIAATAAVLLFFEEGKLTYHDGRWYCMFTSRLAVTAQAARARGFDLAVLSRKLRGVPTSALRREGPPATSPVPSRALGRVVMSPTSTLRNLYNMWRLGLIEPEFGEPQDRLRMWGLTDIGIIAAESQVRPAGFVW